MDEAKHRIKEILKVLPQSTLEYGFAYGSGALPQDGENPEDKMLDYIVSTTDAQKFHTDNLEKNPSHYSTGCRLLGARGIAHVQRRLGARVFYNTQVTVGKRKIKYGVISTEDLQKDLLDWRWLYTAGRLHKPVLEVIEPTSQIADSVAVNRNSALQTAFLLLPDSFTVTELLHAVVGISYSGDFRMYIGEDKNKVAKIVKGSEEQLAEIYRPLLDNDTRVVINDDKVLQDVSGTAMYHRLNLLPSAVLGRLQQDWNRKNKRQKDQEEVLFALAHRHDVSPHVAQALRSIVGPAALKQTAKNALAAGFRNSFIYAWAKINKMAKSIR